MRRDGDTHIPSDISRGYTKHGDTHITVTPEVCFGSWQNCHGYLLLLLILLIVTLIVAAQLLWQYFMPSSLVAALAK